MLKSFRALATASVGRSAQTDIASGIFTYDITGLRLLHNDFLASPRRRKIFSPLGLFVDRRFDLEPAVEVVLGGIDGNVPAHFAVEVKPQEILVFGRDADHAVGNA